MPNSTERTAIKQVGDEFFILSHLLRKYVDTAMTQSGVPLARSKLLATLVRYGPSRVTELAEYAHTAVRSATQAVDALERDGLAVRQPDPTDRRAALVTITDAGREASRAARKPLQTAYDELFGTLSADERTTFLATLAKLRAAAGQG
jgi:DNA-binding MarR family transcriptional regulator